MTNPRLTPTVRRHAARLLAIASLAALAAPRVAQGADHPTAIEKRLDGVWRIESRPPAKPGAVVEPNTLPDGTRVRIEVGGPTALAEREDREDELALDFDVLPPWTPALCGVSLGTPTMFGANLCNDDGTPRDPQATARPEFEVGASFSRMTAKEAAGLDRSFFVDLGARAGARFALVTVKYKGSSWDLWMKTPDLMIEEGLLVGPGRHEADGFPVYWRREK